MTKLTLIALSLPLAFALVVQLSCLDKDDGGDGTTGTTTDGGATGTTTDGGTTGTTTDTDGGVTDSSISGNISGTVSVQFYTTSEIDGERVNIAWEDTVFGDSFPFGAIMVSATQDDDSGGLYYRGTDTISSPNTAGDAYSISARLPEDGNVRLYATLDYVGDGIISTSEPFGTYPDEVDVQDGSTADDKDIVILMDYDAALAWWLGGGGGGGGGSCDNPIYLSGSATITSGWTSGDVAVLLYDQGGNGPYYYDRATPTEIAGGAEAPFSIGFCGELGEMDMLGAWDQNQNGLIDPADTWGAYITKPDVDGNPLNITGDMADLEVQIPLGDGRSGLNIVPFVSLNGNVTYLGGESFDKLSDDSVVYLVALMYRPEGDIAVETLASDAYDSDSWTSSDYAGVSSLPFTLWVPADTIVYLWAYVDEGPKPDGYVNTSGELVGGGGDENTGRIPTGTTSSTGLYVDLGYGG